MNKYKFRIILVINLIGISTIFPAKYQLHENRIQVDTGFSRMKSGFTTNLFSTILSGQYMFNETFGFKGAWASAALFLDNDNDFASGNALVGLIYNNTFLNSIFQGSLSIGLPLVEKYHSDIPFRGITLRGSQAQRGLIENWFWEPDIWAIIPSTVFSKKSGSFWGTIQVEVPIFININTDKTGKQNRTNFNFQTTGEIAYGNVGVKVGTRLNLTVYNGYSTESKRNEILEQFSFEPFLWFGDKNLFVEPSVLINIDEPLYIELDKIDAYMFRIQAGLIF